MWAALWESVPGSSSRSVTDRCRVYIHTGDTHVSASRGSYIHAYITYIHVLDAQWDVCTVGQYTLVWSLASRNNVCMCYYGDDMPG